jgi:hypothetical protein
MLKAADTGKYVEKIIEINKIKAQYNPDRFKYWLSLHNGPYPDALNMKYSPHYRFLIEYEKNNNLDWRNTPYYQLQKLYGRKKDWIYEKIEKFLTIYGVLKNYGKVDPIQVVSKPFIPSVFNNSYEIFEGHHRTACYLALGKTEILCQELIR